MFLNFCKKNIKHVFNIYDSEGPSEQKPIKHFGEKGAWAYPGTAQFFWVPPIISGTGKATNFKFCTHINFIGSIGTKAH